MMTGWRPTTLRHLLRIVHGYAFKGEHFSDSGHHVLLTPGNFYEEGGFKLRPGKDRFYVGDIPERYILPKGSMIAAMTEQAEGLLGSPAIMPESGRYLHNQRLGLVRPFGDRADLRFLYHLFNTNLVRQQLRNSSSGAKVRHTSPERIYRVEVTVPDVPIQRKIAAILTAYDDLIEINKRRIALLEKMAEELYREWFVRMRFPGHQNTKFVKGVPVEWETKRLGDILELAYGKALKESDREPGEFHVYGSGGIVGSHSTALVKDQGIIVGRKGNVGAIHFSDRGFFPIDTVFYVISNLPLTFLFFLLRTMNFINNDAAVPGLNRNQAYSNQLFYPGSDLITKFSMMVDPLFVMNQKLQAQNENLTKTRDLLLPRLISGKLSVEDLDIQFPPSMREEV